MDIVLVAVPVRLTARSLQQALLAGKAVFAEKPFADDTAEGATR